MSSYTPGDGAAVTWIFQSHLRTDLISRLGGLGPNSLVKLLFSPFCVSLLSCFPIFKRLRFYLILEWVINRTRQKTLWEPPSSPCVPLRFRDLEHHPGSEGPRTGEGCFHLQSKHHLCWRGKKGISLQQEKWNLSETEHARSPAWLQDDEISGQDKDCSQADIWVLMKVSFYIVYVFTFPSWDVPKDEGRWQACTALSMLLISIWQDTVLSTDLSSHQLTALSPVSQQSWKFPAKLRLHTW